MGQKVVIIGGCAGAKVAGEIFDQKGWDVWFSENHTADWGAIKPRILSDSETIAFLAHEDVAWFVATGDNVDREIVVNEFSGIATGPLSSEFHPSAVVSKYSTVGGGTIVCAQAVVGVGCRLGRGVIVNTSASVDHDCVVMDFAQISPGAHIAGYCEIGQRAFVGTGASIIPHVSIGHDAVVAAGAVVIKDVEPYGMVAGVPAVLKKVLR